MYKDDLLSIFNLRQGGLAIYGGVIAAVLTVIVFAKVKKLSAAQIFDTAGLGLVLGQAIGRWEISLTGKHLVSIQMDYLL